jgi:hypothetical protein
MQAERDHLVRFVFPRLRKDLLPHGIHLVDVDLRWGVTSEQDALQVCCEIIDECRPRFLCILGGRYGWVPPGRSRSITADEVHYGVLDRASGDRGYAYFYFRDETTTASMEEATAGEYREPPGSESQKKLAELKQSIVGMGLQPFVYPARWDHDSKRLIELKAFGDRVYDDLLGSLKSDPELRGCFAAQRVGNGDEFAEEGAAMEAFIAERSVRFVLGSRGAVQNEVIAHTSAVGGNGYLCLAGAPGSGKSALLAQFYKSATAGHCPSTPDRKPPLFICHFVGASPGSTDVHRTLRRLCHELKVGCPNVSAEIPDTPEQLRAAFPELLRQAAAVRHVVILLDGVEQFDWGSYSAGLDWLPDELPADTRIVLSRQSWPRPSESKGGGTDASADRSVGGHAENGQALDDAIRRLKPREIGLQPLTRDDGRAIIEEFQKRYRKCFEPDQLVVLLAKAEAGTPLYLLTALEELRTLGR